MNEIQTVEKGGWAFFYSKLVEQFPGLKSDGKSNLFQFAAAPMEAAWWQNSDFNSYVIADKGPQNIGGYYTPSQFNIHDAYSDFMNNVRFLVPPDNPAYQACEDNLRRAIAALENANTDANNKFKAWLANNPEHATLNPDIHTRNDWLNTEGHSSKETIDLAQIDVDQYQKEIKRWQDAQIAHLQEALDAFKLGDNWHTTTMPDSGGNIKIPNLTITPSLNQKLALWKTGSGNTIKLTITQDSHAETHWMISGGADASYTNGFIGGYAGGSMTVADDVWTDNNLNVEIEIAAVELFTIAYGGWWKGDILTEYKNGPFYDQRLQTATFFGENGTLKLVPSSVLVGFKPKCMLTISDSIYTKHKTDWEGHAGIRIGPFSIGISTHSVKVTEGGQKNTKTITWEPKDDRPQVIGVLSDLHLYA